MTENSQNTVFPVLPLRDIVVFPHMIVPLFVGREKSIHALEEVMKDDKHILLVAQKNASQDDPGRDDIYRVGTVSSVLQLLKLPDGTVKVLVEGNSRARIKSFVDNPRFFQVQAELLAEGEGEVARDRGPGARGRGPVRAVREAQQEGAARGPGLAVADRRPGQARRHRGGAPVA